MQECKCISNHGSAALGSLEQALRMRLSAAPHCVRFARCSPSFANLPCGEQLLVSLSHTTKRQYALLHVIIYLKQQLLSAAVMLSSAALLSNH